MNTVNTLTIIEANLLLMREGVWTMSGVRIDDDSQSLEEGQSVDIEFNGRTGIKGTIVDVEVFDGYTTGTIIGGGNKISKQVESGSYSSTTIRTIVNDICRKLGVTLSTTSSGDLLSQRVDRFVKIKDSGANVIEKLLDKYNALWRILLDGTLYVGYKTSTPLEAQNLEIEILTKDRKRGIYNFFYEDNIIEPIYTFEDKEIYQVSYELEGSELSMNFHFYEPSFLLEKRYTTNDSQTFYSRIYRMKVLSQSSNGNLDLVPDPDIDLLKNGVRDIPIQYSRPDEVLKVKQGALCCLQFFNGDPTLPVVTGFINTGVSNDLTSVSIADGVNPQPAARKTDRVNVGSLTVAGMGVTLTYTAPNGTIIGPSTTVAISLAEISEGSSKVNIGE